MIGMVVKRVFDLFFSMVLLILLFPLFIVCISILWATGEHEIWYWQQRVGHSKTVLKVLKFVTMQKNSMSEQSGDITLQNDPRILPFGHLLRITKINELPQLINVLLGSMSIVGPRPLTENLFSYYTADVQDTIANLKPGITGIGSIIFRNEDRYTAKVDNPHLFYRECISPYKGSLEMWYARNCSVKTDLLLIVLTAWVIISPKSNLPYKWLRNLPTKPMWMD